MGVKIAAEVGVEVVAEVEVTLPPLLLFAACALLPASLLFDDDLPLSPRFDVALLAPPPLDAALSPACTAGVTDAPS